MEKTCDNCQLSTDFGCCLKFGYHADRCDTERDWVKKIIWNDIETEGNPKQSGYQSCK